MHQNTQNYNSNIHFGPPWYPGGASGAQNLKMALPGGYLEDRLWVLWNFCSIFGHLTLFRWLKCEILTLVIYHTPLIKMLKCQWNILESTGPSFEEASASYQTLLFVNE